MVKRVGDAYLKKPVLTCTWTLVVGVAIPSGTYERLQEYATAHQCTSMRNFVIFHCSIIPSHIVWGRCSQGKASIDSEALW